MKKLTQITLFVIFTVAVFGLMGFIYIENGKQTVNDIVIRVCRSNVDGFLSDKDIRLLIEDVDSIGQRKVSEVNILGIEKMVSASPFIEQVDAFINIDKNLVINVEEKRAVLRIFTRKNTGYYIDIKGNMFPLNTDYSPKVLVANGYIDGVFSEGHESVFDTIYKSDLLRDLYALTNLIMENQFLDAQISQVYVNSKGEYDLIPELGDHLIKFGDIENAEEKLNNLIIWYKKAMVNEQWDKYKEINLKYKDQVVCTKK